jgi:hypothetical protein
VSAILNSVAEPHHFDAALALGKNFDAALGFYPNIYRVNFLLKQERN